MNLDQILGSYSGASALWGPFGLLLLCGLGLPVPEDIVLVAAGFLGAENGIKLMHIMIVMYAGILLGDSIVYFLGRFFGRNIIDSRVGKFLISKNNLYKAEDAFKKYGRWVIFVGRFLPGLRAPIFFSAGLLRFSVLRFWLMDGVAALVSAPLFVWLGHIAWEKYANDLLQLEKTLGRTKLYFGIALFIAVTIAFLYFRSRKKKNALAKSSESAL